MLHLGDIKNIHGYDIPPVDVVTGGSPCQDISLARYNRAGLAGNQSSLFFEYIRVVKEMRQRDRDNGRPDDACRPRWVVFENVPGLFSSGTPKGADFQTVLTEIVRIADPEAPDVPLPDKGWPKSGYLYDEMGRWSIAYTIHDAAEWGVPQRRLRISVVGCFGSGTGAAEVLFERESLFRDPEKG